MDFNNTDFGITTGLTGLYGSFNKSESAKSELATLSALKQQIDADKQQEELAQLKEQQYQAQISEFANKLLAPDRDRINAKAKVLSKKVREHVQLYGGDMDKFFKNGGHRVLGDYRNSLINSPESSTYLDNKQNMEYLLKIQLSGKGHLINPTDMRNLEEYQKNKKGSITYTGIMNEIEMPDADMYDYGSEIPAKDILRNKANYTKIYGNYKLTFPNAGEPSEADLIAFVENNYKGKGSNWRRQYALEQQKAKQLQQLAKLKKEDEGVFDKNYRNQYSGQVQRLFSYMKPDMTINDFKQGFWDKFEYKNQLNNVATGDYKEFGTHYSLDHDSVFDYDSKDGFFGILGGLQGTRLGEWLEEEYAPRNAKKFFNGREIYVAKSALNIENEDQIDYSGKKVLNMLPNSEWYDAMGNKLEDLEDKVNYEKYKGDYNVKGVINIGTIQTQNNGRTMENIVMNVVDQDGSVEQDKTDKLDKGYGNGQIGHKLAVVLQNEEGITFYAPINVSDAGTINKLQQDLSEYDDIVPAVQDQYNRKVEEAEQEKFTAEQEVQVDSFWNEVESRPDYLSPIYSELVQFSKNGQYDGVRDNLVKSFYGTMAMLVNPQKTKADDIKNFTGNAAFTIWTKQAEQEAQQDYTSDISNYNISDTDIIKKMFVNDEKNQNIYSLWLQNYNYISKKE